MYLLGAFIITRKWSLEIRNSKKLAIFLGFLLFLASRLHFLVEVNAPIIILHFQPKFGYSKIEKQRKGKIVKVCLIYDMHDFTEK